MPQIQAAKKALRVSARRRAVNDQWRKKIREASRDMRDALKDTDKKQALTSFVKFQSVIDRAAKHAIIHPKTAARKKSRLRAAIDKMKK